MAKLTTKLVGITFGDCPDNIQSLCVGYWLSPISYHFNEGELNEDPYAVKIMDIDKMMGHIPKPLNKKIHGCTNIICQVTDLTKIDGKVVSVTVEITYDPKPPTRKKKPVPKKQKKKVLVKGGAKGQKPPWEPTRIIKSFNEKGVEVEFYASGYDSPRPEHWYGDVRLRGVTRKIDVMYNDFDPSIARFCEDKYGLPADEIRSAWSMNGNVAAGFGSSAHEAMENYEITKHNGFLLPKMPILQEIVTSFPNRETDHVFTEVFVTDIKRSTCGYVDRVELKGGVLYVGDYKFNVNSLVRDTKKHKNLLFPDAEKTKRFHFLCQLSYYAQLLADGDGTAESAGAESIEVSDSVFPMVWDGAWKIHEMKRIDQIVEQIETFERDGRPCKNKKKAPRRKSSLDVLATW